MPRVGRSPPSSDASGQRFSIDVKYGAADWREDDIVGCAYVGKGDLYVKRADGLSARGVPLREGRGAGRRGV
jgi:hypothetical protein